MEDTDFEQSLSHVLQSNTSLAELLLKYCAQVPRWRLTTIAQIVKTNGNIAKQWNL